LRGFQGERKVYRNGTVISQQLMRQRATQGGRGVAELTRRGGKLPMLLRKELGSARGLMGMLAGCELAEDVLECVAKVWRPSPLRLNAS